MSRATDEEMSSLHGDIAVELRARIKSGEATGADISNAIKFLKDNHIEVASGTRGLVGDLLETMNNLKSDNDGGFVQ